MKITSRIPIKKALLEKIEAHLPDTVKEFEIKEVKYIKAMNKHYLYCTINGMEDLLCTQADTPKPDIIKILQDPESVEYLKSL
jgi:hypothetical protein